MEIAVCRGQPVHLLPHARAAGYVQKAVVPGGISGDHARGTEGAGTLQTSLCPGSNNWPLGK